MPTKNPRPWEYDDSLPEPDEATWQVVKFTVNRKDGGIVDAELLRPRSWVEANGLEVGRLLPIDIEELQIEGTATVTAIEAAPAIATGEGSAVTGRFNTRRVDEICRIRVLGADGQIDTIEGTTLHPIWSVDAGDWVPLGELEEGEQLLSSLPSPHLGRGIEGEGQTATILTHQVLHRTTPVYNIEIHGQHVYEIGVFGILAHNTCYTNSGQTVLGHFPGYIQKAQAKGASYFDIGDAWDALTDAQRWAANRGFLDNIAAAGDRVLLSLPKSKIRPDSYLTKEIQYLIQEKGYRWINQWALGK